MMLIPPPAASLEAAGRLNERYRSNSLDSILVADLDAKTVQSTEHIQVLWFHEKNVQSGGWKIL